MSRTVALGVFCSLVVGLGACAGAAPPGEPDGSGTAARESATVGQPLAGKVVALDPGHQLGNRYHPARINRLVSAGPTRKPCNTTGTATNSGYPEATFNWQVSLGVKRQLEALGARVIMTRNVNSPRRWGPCVDYRGRFGNPAMPGPTADLKLSIHADGSYAAGARGFHVIRPGSLRGWTADIAGPSRRLAGVVRNRLVRGGFRTSTYRGHNGIDVRTDLGTLNLSNVPTVLVELGNMRNARDAATMKSATGRQRYARALVSGLRAYLTR